MDFELKETQRKSEYLTEARATERVYGEPLSYEMLTLGQELDNLADKHKQPFNPKAWVAWMRKAEIYQQSNRVIVRVPDRKYEFFIDYIFGFYHSLLAKHYNKKVYYAGHGREILDKAGYDLIRYENLSEEEKKYYDDGWAEVKRNIASMVNKTWK